MDLDQSSSNDGVADSDDMNVNEENESVEDEIFAEEEEPSSEPSDQPMNDGETIEQNRRGPIVFRERFLREHSELIQNLLREATIRQPIETTEQNLENAVSYDTNLPGEHLYLGDNMSRVPGVEYLDVNRAHRIMLFLHQNVVFPGEVLPFMVPSFIIDSTIGTTNEFLFGVTFPRVRAKETDAMIYGVTCQIYEKRIDERGHTLVKSRALQRFVTLRDTEIDHLEYITAGPQTKKYGYVKILPEIYLPEPLRAIDMGSMNRFRGINAFEKYFTNYQIATTSWPAHIYKYYNINALIEKARLCLASHKIDTLPQNPISLSFWLARNLHFSEEQLKDIFITDSVNMRLKIISDTFKDGRIFVCRFCKNTIAKCSDLFAMSKHGVQSQYCNSAGYIHETNTVHRISPDSVKYSGEPSSEFSWFPGYSWRIMICKSCKRHIGWRFRAVEPNLTPDTFYGLSGASVRIGENPTVMNVDIDYGLVRRILLANGISDEEMLEYNV